MTKRQSATQMAAEIISSIELDHTFPSGIVHALLREDRERRQMERAIVAVVDKQDWSGIIKIARRLARKEGK